MNASNHVLLAVFVRVYRIKNKVRYSGNTLELTFKSDWNRSPWKCFKQSILDVKEKRVFLFVYIYQKLQVHISIEQRVRQDTVIPSTQTARHFIYKLSNLDLEPPAHFEVRDFQTYRLRLTDKEELCRESAGIFGPGFKFDFVKPAPSHSSQFGGFIFVIRAVEG